MVTSASESLGARVLLIHCEDEAAGAFYRHLGEFDVSPGDLLHLFLLMSDLRRTLGAEDLG